MRTVELPDDVYERAVRVASARGLTVVEYLGQKVQEDAAQVDVKTTGKRLDFPLIRSGKPGTLHITKAVIEQVELDDYLGRLGSPD